MDQHGPSLRIQGGVGVPNLVTAEKHLWSSVRNSHNVAIFKLEFIVLTCDFGLATKERKLLSQQLIKYQKKKQLSSVHCLSTKNLVSTLVR